MAGLTALKPGNTYGKILIFKTTGNTGISSTAASITDGLGTTLPFKVSTTAIKLGDGKYLYFADNNYIYNPGADKLKIKSASIVLNGAVSLSGKFTGVSGYLVSQTVASVIRSKNIKLTGLASMATVSATTLKGTNVKVTGVVSCASIKASIDFTALTGKTINLNSMPIKLYSASTVLDGNISGIHFRYAGTGADTIRFTSSTLEPQTTSQYNLGTAGKYFKTVYGTTGVFTTANIATANLTGGTFTAIGAIGASKLNASTVSMKRELKLNGVSIYFDTAKRFSAKYIPSASAIAIDTPASTIYIKSDNSIYPSTADAVDLGKTANRFGTIHTASIAVNSNLRIQGTNYTKYLNITGIPVTSTGLATGDVYAIANVLKIIP